MRRTLFTLLGLLLFVFASYSQGVEIKLPAKGANGYLVSQATDYGFNLNYNLSSLTAVEKKTPAGQFVTLSSRFLGKTFGHGEPMLPAFSRLIQVPFGADVKVTVVSADYKIINIKDYGIKEALMPAQPSLRKDLDPTTHFLFDKEAYSKDEFIQKPLATYQELGIKRDVRLGRIQINPIAYNPTKGQLKVYYNIKVRVEFVHPDLALTKKITEKYAIPGDVAKSLVINQLPATKNVGIPTNFPLTYVIVAPAEFKNDPKLDEFIAWKKAQGYNVIVGYAGDNIGTTIDDIKNWVQDLYNNPPAGTNPPAYLLVIGDVDKIPAHQFNEITDQPYSDLYYVEYTGDYHPEIDFGRISADNTTELENALTKILYYERDQFANDYSFLHEVLMVPGDDEQHEDTWGNGQIWYGVNYYFNSDHNIYSHTFYQDPEDHGVPGGNQAVHDSILADISNGISFANYTAHCSPDGWYSPSFTRSDLDALTNQDKYSVWIGNCCQSFKFDEEDAFGEKALYIANKGAAGYIGGSQYTYWDEDYYWGVGYGSVVAQPTYDQTGRGVYDASFHDMPNEVNDPSVWALSIRQLIDAGNLAVDQSGSDMIDYYWTIYQVSGDPSMIMRIGTPQTATISLEPMIVGTSTITGTTLPYAFVSVTQDGQLVGVGMADGNGNLSINTLDAIPGGMLHVVVYGQNMTVLQQDIPAYVPDKPYLIVTELNPQSINYNSSADLTVKIGNINDSLSATDVYVKLTSLDSNVTVNTDSLYIGNFGTDTVEYANAFNISVGNLRDNYTFRLQFDIHGTYNDTDYVWTSKKTMFVKAPNLKIANLEFADPQDNGYIDLGTTDTLLVTLENNGSAAANNVVVKLTCNNSDVVLPDSQVVAVAADTSIIVKMAVQVPDNALEGVKTMFYVNAAQDVYTANDSISEWVGQPAEVVIGDGTEEVHYPLYSYWRNEKTQILYKASDLAGAHMINTIGFQIKQGQAWTFHNFKIYMKETDLDTLSSNSYTDLSDAVLVVDDSTLDFPGGLDSNFFTIDLNHPFFYSGNGNLFVEVVWGPNPDYQPSDDKIINLGTAVNYTAVDYGLSDYQTPPDFDEAQSVIPNTKFVFQPFGDIFVAVPQPFVDSVLHETDFNIPLTVKNYGKDTAQNVTVTLQVLDSGVTAIDTIEVIPTLLPNQSVTIDDAFRVHIGALADLHEVNLKFVTPNMSQVGKLIVKAPKLTVLNYALENNNGYIPGGQNDNLLITLVNNGHDGAPTTHFTLTSSNSNLLVIGNAPDPVDIGTGDTVTVSFPISAANIDSSVKITLDLQAVTGSYTFNDQSILWINIPMEQYIGEGADSTHYYPFYQLYENEKTQILFHSDEFISTPINITKYGVKVKSLPDDLINYKNLTINLFTTDQDSANDAYFTANSDKVTVFTTSSYTPVVGWNIFNFDTPYPYDGTSNLVVEIIWGDNGDWYTGRVYMYADKTDFKSVAYGYADAETPPNYDDESDLRPMSYFAYATYSLTAVNTTENNITITPNPNNGKFFINNAEGYKVVIFDMTGKQIYNGQISSDREQINLGDVPAGVYTVQLTNKQNRKVAKLIVH